MITTKTPTENTKEKVVYIWAMFYAMGYVWLLGCLLALFFGMTDWGL